ncbi:MAG: hypothetical protein IJD60_09830 [Clostridia bacterium]|nr:hypothetical protein [Clostridia bacterium]
MGDQAYQYQLKLAIDYGSTNTVMAFYVYERDGENGFVKSAKLMPEENVKRIPSIMVLKADNPYCEAVQADAYGQEAENIVKNSNEKPVVCDNFKQKLYTAESGSAEYAKGVELTTKFFEHLRKVYLKSIYNMLPQYVRDSLQVIVYLSTPVRGNLTHRTLMKKIAQDAGFTAQNGVTEICTDYNEAQCVVRYAMEHAQDEMKDMLVKAGTPQGALLMFVDVGGSTMDISLERLTISTDGREKMDPLGEWPDADVAYPLGGCLVDAAIKEYLIAQGFAEEAYTREKWETADGKYRFRVFKEENNRKLSEGGVIDKLGMLGSVCFDYTEGVVPSVNYNKAASGKIDRQIFEEKICREYVEQMHAAIGKLFAAQRHVEGMPQVKPADVDAVFLAGDGSRLFVIEEALRSERMGLKQIREKPERLFNRWENPSLCCALGALAETKNVAMPSYAANQYMVEIGVYDLSDSLAFDYIRKHPDLLDPEKPGFTLGGKEFTYQRLFGSGVKVADKFAMLPQRASGVDCKEYVDRCQSSLMLSVHLYRVNEQGEMKLLGAPYVHTLNRKFSDALINFLKLVQETAFLLPANLLAMLVDKVLSLIGIETHIEKAVDKYSRARYTTLLTKGMLEAELSYDLTLTEKNELKGRIAVTSRFFKLSEDTFEIAF